MTGAYPKIGLKGASPNDLSWMTGVWAGRNGEDFVEELWSEPKDETLCGLFRWVGAEGLKFYEIAVIEKDGQHVFLRIRHFDRGLVAWEEKNHPFTLMLTYHSEQEAAFVETAEKDPRWAVYKRVGRDRLLSYFTKNTEPLAHPGVFDYARRKQF